MKLLLTSIVALTLLHTGSSALACKNCGCGEKGKSCSEGKEKCDCKSCKKGESCGEKKEEKK